MVSVPATTREALVPSLNRPRAALLTLLKNRGDLMSGVASALKVRLQAPLVSTTIDFPVVRNVLFPLSGTTVYASCDVKWRRVTLVTQIHVWHHCRCPHLLSQAFAVNPRYPNVASLGGRLVLRNAHGVCPEASDTVGTRVNSNLGWHLAPPWTETSTIPDPANRYRRRPKNLRRTI